MCYSDKCKHMCSRIVIGVSILMALMGLISVIFGFMQIGKVPGVSDAVKSSFNVNLEGAGKGVGLVTVLLGIAALMVACLGCFTGKTKNKCCAIPYGILTFGICIVFLVAGAISFGMASKLGRDTIYAAVCSGSVVNPLDNTQSVESPLNLGTQYNKFVDQPACSELCPCPSNKANSFDPATLSQKDLLKFNRFVSAKSNLKAYKTYPTSSEQSGATPLIFTANMDSKVKSYGTY